MNRVVQVVRTGSLAPRSGVPLGTHLPVLVGLSRIVPLRRVLEFGCGRYSTLNLLDRAVFPDLEALDSFETDPAWADEIAAATRHDPRVRLTTVKGAMADAADAAAGDYDLVFIDDSKSGAARAATILAVAERKPRLVAVHDFEVFAYRRAAAAGFRHVFRFGAINPHTGLMWAPLEAADGLGPPVAELRRLNDLVRRHARSVPHDDARQWAAVMDREWGAVPAAASANVSPAG
jgi:predicted O-methyltransferase YrrM